MPEVSVIIPNYNGVAYIRDCLDALQTQTGPAFEIIFVDNGSADESTAIVETEYPDVRLLKLDKNYGFSKAVNEGILAARAPYVILLNNDTKVQPDFVAQLWTAIRADEKLFCVQAKMLQMHDPSKIDSAGDYYCALGWAFSVGKDAPADRYTASRKIFSGCAGAAIYRKKALQDLGLFDEMHFAYLEDVDVGYRARIHGMYNAFCPEALVYHVGSGFSGSRYNDFKVRLSAQNSIYLVYKNMPWLQILLNLPFLLPGFLLKILFFIRKGHIAAYAQGMRQGFGLCRTQKKVRFHWSNFINYCKIQWELWRNLPRMIGKY
ncbi:MAG: glycosyltransferase family 2 protein [Lachnospiraceae bacterium]